jgi:hypothetical protein
MTRSRLLMLGAATAAIASTAIIVTSASGNANPTSSRRTLTVIEHAETDTLVDLGPTGDSRGDQLAFYNPVFDQTDGKQVGHSSGSCIRTAPGVVWECSWTLTLAQGSLAVQGPFRDAGDSVLAITGGTGIYSTARGSMGLHALNAAGSKYRFTYHVQG